MHCEVALQTAADTLKGKNNLFQGDLLIGERSDESCCTVQEATPLQSCTPLPISSGAAIEEIARGTPYFLNSQMSKSAASMVHTLLENLKSPSCKVLSETQPGATLLLEATESGVLSVNIGISGLQPTLNPLAQSLTNLTSWYGELTIDSNWESILDDAHQNAQDVNTNTLYWVESFQQWVFLNITSDGNNLVMMIWSWLCSDNVNHYALFEFENIESVRQCLKSLLNGRTANAGFL